MSGSDQAQSQMLRLTRITRKRIITLRYPVRYLRLRNDGIEGHTWCVCDGRQKGDMLLAFLLREFASDYSSKQIRVRLVTEESIVEWR